MKYRDKWDRVIKALQCIFSESAMSELESLETQRTCRQLADSPFDIGRFDSFLLTVTKHKYRTIQCIVMINNWIWYGVLLNWNIHIWIHELLWEIEYVEEGKVRADFIKCWKFEVTNCLLYRTVRFCVSTADKCSNIKPEEMPPFCGGKSKLYMMFCEFVKRWLRDNWSLLCKDIWRSHREGVRPISNDRSFWLTSNTRFLIVRCLDYPNVLSHMNMSICFIQYEEIYGTNLDYIIKYSNETDDVF